MQSAELILASYPLLSPKLQVAARFVVDHPNDVVIYSMRGLAELAKVQPSTLVRLAQHLGYAGWPELKSAFATDLGLHSGRYGQRAKSLSSRAQQVDLVDEMFGVQRQNLDVTEALCKDALHDVVQRLRQAKAVHIAGFRASLPVAYALVYGYRLFRNSVHLIDAHPGGLEMQMRAIEPDDAVMSISFAPYSVESVAVTKAARSVGAQVIAFTDSHVSPLALAADATILFSADSPSFFPSIAAAMAVTETLLELLVAGAHLDDSIAQKISNAEKQLFDSGAYLPPSGKSTADKPKSAA